MCFFSASKPGHSHNKSVLRHQSDPLNQDPSGKSWAIGTPPQLYSDSDGNYYKYSPARFNGNNYYPIDKYNPANPSPYGDGVGLMPNENVIHTANGYYNPTLEVETGKWATFFFENFSLNSTHLIQLIRRDENGALSVERSNILGTDWRSISLGIAPVDRPTSPVNARGAYRDSACFHEAGRLLFHLKR